MLGVKATTAASAARPGPACSSERSSRRSVRDCCWAQNLPYLLLVRFHHDHLESPLTGDSSPAAQRAADSILLARLPHKFDAGVVAS